jgi:glyoxalase family protein
MDKAIAGIHHVTAIARDPQRNVDFYTEVLGLRLVKQTVNFDDPGTYHLYFGDELGRPGTLLTFFAWPLARRGSRGAAQATAVSFGVPAGSLGWWRERLERRRVDLEPPRGRRPQFGEEVLTLLDPDGLKLELVEQAGSAERPSWSGGPVPGEHAVRGLAGVTLTEWNPEITAELLTGVLGFALSAEEGDRRRFTAGGGSGLAGAGAGAGEVGHVGTSWLDVVGAPAAERGRISAGTVHHVAWRTAGDAEQAAWREELAGRGLRVSPILDRQYFHSIYFHEPGGVLFEIATDPPGMTADEPAASLGEHLKLPPWLEPSRATLAAALPPLRVGQVGRGDAAAAEASGVSGVEAGAGTAVGEGIGTGATSGTEASVEVGGEARG